MCHVLWMRMATSQLKLLISLAGWARHCMSHVHENLESMPKDICLVRRSISNDAVNFHGCRYVKDADKAIIAHLKTTGRLIDVSSYSHSYPFCWRSDTPLIYKVLDALNFGPLIYIVSRSTFICALYRNHDLDWLGHVSCLAHSLPRWAPAGSAELVCEGDGLQGQAAGGQRRHLLGATAREGRPLPQLARECP